MSDQDTKRQEHEQRVREEILYQWECYLANPQSLAPGELELLKTQARLFGVDLKGGS